jgi:hypothetical protein
MTIKTKSEINYRLILLSILTTIIWVSFWAYVSNNEMVGSGLVALIISTSVFVGYFYIVKFYFKNHGSTSRNHFEVFSISFLAAFFALFLFYMLTFSIG